MATITEIAQKFEKANIQVRKGASPSGVEAFENKAGVELPEDYRSFIINVGNGGRPPCRLLSLDNWDYSYWIKNPEESFAGEPCLLSPKCREHGENWLEHLGIAEAGDLWDQNKWDPMFGTIAIAEIGCGLSFSMVITGEYRSRIFSWGDHAEIPPVFYPELSFSEWMGNLLNKKLNGRPVHFLDGRLK
ncbi:MAG: SMI1/KNR4 family protein [Desulfobacteraceae bacterium]|nr:SMI1/KNR4 family protein [Desulfobacteraceae bacterium]